MILFADKPAGVTTHTSLADRSEKTGALVDANDGLVEHLTDRSGRPLFVVHRLDRDTTGAMIFAESKETAESLRLAFESRTIQKRYLFLTDRRATRAEFAIASWIERRGANYVSESPSKARPANAVTKLKLVEESHGLALWEALPETGKPHQIRLHAASVGIPIHGDTIHGGSPFPAMCLHSQRIANPGGPHDFEHVSPPPRWFVKRELVATPLVARWLAAVDRRERWLRSLSSASGAMGGATRAAVIDSSETIRWIHTEGDPLRVDQLGDVHALSWFSDRAPGEGDLRAIEILAEEYGWKKWTLQLRRDRGGGSSEDRPQAGPGQPSVASIWLARENGLVFEMRSNQGLSPGLFLDQRRNREWVMNHARGMDVLNLFSYTGGFSVAAAKGGAKRVVTVDLSKNFLEWSKVNFKLNDLALDGHEFRAIDGREYLAWARKKAMGFDLIVCDPPSFSRSSAGVFKIEEGLAELIGQLLAVTKPGGRILFATNFEGWTEAQLETRLRTILEDTKSGAFLARTPSPDWDFELPGSPHVMKSVFLVGRTAGREPNRV